MDMKVIIIDYVSVGAKKDPNMEEGLVKNGLLNMKMFKYIEL